MCWLIILVFKKKYFYAVILFLICFYIRPLFYTFIITFILYYLILVKLHNQKIFNYIFYIIILILLIIFSQNLIDKFNYFILVYNKEDAGWGSEINENNIIFVELSFSSFFSNIKTVIDKLLLNWPVPLNIN